MYSYLDSYCSCWTSLYSRMCVGRSFIIKTV